MKEDRNMLPYNWISTPLETIISTVKGKKPKILGSKSNDLQIPYIDIKAIERKIFSKYTNRENCTMCEPDDNLIVWDGARCGWVGRGASGAVGSTLARIDTFNLSKSYLYYFLMSKFKEINTKPKGVGIPHVDRNIFYTFNFPLPPLPEQHRIVEKIEELFTRLDAGVENLKQVQAQLKRYRQSVLKATVKGRLTAEWREKHKNELEPADKLLERIQTERKKKLGNKYKEPTPPNTTDLPELPEGWVWAKLGQITHLITKGASPRWQGFDYADHGIKFIRSQNVGWGRLDTSKIAFLPEAFNMKEKKSILKKEDVLLNIVGASIGRAAIATEEVENANINQAVSVIRLIDGILINKFLMYYLISVDAQSRIHRKTVDVARANLSLTDISELCVPVPPFNEQIAIVEEIERLFSITNGSEALIEYELKRSQSLRQSVLKHAFLGKLVPQDPNDEPASVLLERIKADKGKAKKSKQMEIF